MLHEHLKKYTIILASKSPRRQYLLNELGLQFKVVTKPGIDEQYPKNLKQEKIVLYLAKQKSQAYQPMLNDIIITADTIVWLDDEVINKPQNIDEAQKMLQKLSGKKHLVYTGVCIKSTQKEVLFFDKTEVYFKKLKKEEIEFYIQNFKPFDKAGAYGVQEWIGYIGIEKIIGSYFNVMGLPIQKLYETLMTF